MKLKEFFTLSEAPGDPAFKSPSSLGPSPAAQLGQPMQEPEEQSRWDMLPVAIQNHVKDIQRQLSKLERRIDNDPELGEIVHKFLLDLNKYMGEGE